MFLEAQLLLWLHLLTEKEELIGERLKDWWNITSKTARLLFYHVVPQENRPHFLMTSMIRLLRLWSMFPQVESRLSLEQEVIAQWKLFVLQSMLKWLV